MTEVSAHAPQPVPSIEIEPTAIAELDAAVRTLRDAAPGWCATSVDERLELLHELLERTLDAAPAWVAAASRAKGIPADSPHLGEEWGTTIAVILRQLRGLITSLRGIRDTGRVEPPGWRIRDDGQVVVDVFPADWVDRVSLPGFEAEVRLQRGVSLEEAQARIGRLHRPDHEPEPAIACVLGAGNVGSIPVLDTLTQLFAHDRVVVLKMSPVNAYLGPHIGEAFAPLVERGALRVVYGGAEVASHLVHHDEVDAVHLTGSQRTHDAIVFGSGENGWRRKDRGEPIIDVPITSELGSVSPVIVVPGPWNDRDIAYHGDNIASMLVHNAGFNCLAARVVVQHRAWARRQALLSAIRGSLRAAEPRAPYYPGARERWERFVTTYRGAERFGPEGENELPFTLIPELDPEHDDDLAFTTEAFSGVMAEVGLEAPRSVPEYVDAAVELCNERLAGSLVATLIVHPASLRDPEVAAAVERAVDELRYGSVVINHFAGVAFGLASTSWGAYPGEQLSDIGSGRGIVHNSFLLEDVERSVVRGPFRTPYTPAWFHTNRRAPQLWSGIARVTARGDARSVPGLVWHTARG